MVIGGGEGAAGVVTLDLTVGPRFPFLFFGGGGGMASATEVGGGPASTMGMVTLMEVLASSSIISSSSSSSNSGTRDPTPQSLTQGSYDFCGRIYGELLSTTKPP